MMKINKNVRIAIVHCLGVCMSVVLLGSFAASSLWEIVTVATVLVVCSVLVLWLLLQR